jgi:hypothetical protein
LVVAEHQLLELNQNKHKLKMKKKERKYLGKSSWREGKAPLERSWGRGRTTVSSPYFDPAIYYCYCHLGPFAPLLPPSPFPSLSNCDPPICLPLPLSFPSPVALQEKEQGPNPIELRRGFSATPLLRTPPVRGLENC